ncbi:HNH endonuclease [Brucella intermedia]|uniref:HNH endonuclease n=1 Tax=Brucella intermedia TaxID=94625 RepID=UPI00224ACE95|nr:HNH endonuclease [Brucella intermedia]
MHELIDFLHNRMSMTDLYQPAVIRELLAHNGKRSKSQLAAALAQYDLSVQEYYEGIVMRWPKITLTKHGIIDYERRGSLFHLVPYPDDAGLRDEAIALCEAKIAEWRERKRGREKAPEAGASIRYEILKEAGGKCALCGTPATLRPIDIDHIVPRSKADKNGKVRKDGRLIDLNSRENLQALCFSCNRGKRDADETDFRGKGKLVRDGIPALIEAQGRRALVKELTGVRLQRALHEKLIEEHAEMAAATDSSAKCEELADMLEVMFALAEQHGVGREQLLDLAEQKRRARGGFAKGTFFCLRSIPVNDG